MGKLRLDDDQRRILRFLRTRGPTSRITLAKRLQLSATALTKLSRSLLELNLVEDLDYEQQSVRGRPAVPLRISSSGGYSVGVALHRGVLEIALINFAGGIIAQAVEAFESLPPHECARVVRRRIHELADSHRLLGSRMFGVGIGVPGPPNPDHDGQWLIVPSLEGWRNVPLRPIFEEALALPVWIENDANAAALAEYYLGGLIGRCSNALVLLLGHGIGAGIIADGQLLLGERGAAGDIGCLYPGDRPRPSTMDLLAVLQTDGCAVSSVADVEKSLADHTHALEKWTARAAKQLRPSIEAGLVWFNPGAIIISSPLPRELLLRLADRINTDRRWKQIGYYSEYPLQVGISTLGGAAIALGASLLPIHAAEATR